MTDDTGLDAQTRAFVRRIEALAPTDEVPDVAMLRAAFDTMCRADRSDLPEGVTSRDMMAGEVPCRVYTAGDPTVSVVYFHGGGFVLGGLDGHDGICAEICHQTGYRVVSVDYRLAPENPHPAAFDDALQATHWAAEEFADPIVLAGDSAGGNLAAAVAHAARGHIDRLMGQVLIYPWLGSDEATPSGTEHANAPLLTRADLDWFRAARLTGPAPSGDPTFAPLADDDFSRLPPTVVFTADIDPLRDDGRLYVEKIAEAGGQAVWINEAGLVHGYLRARGEVERAQQSFERIGLAIEALGQGLWPY